MVETPNPPRGGGLKNTTKKSCPQGHPYSGNNLIIIKGVGGGFRRQCRICKVEQARQYRNSYRAELAVIRAVRDNHG